MIDSKWSCAKAGVAIAALALAACSQGSSAELGSVHLKTRAIALSGGEIEILATDPGVPAEAVGAKLFIPAGVLDRETEFSIDLDKDVTLANGGASAIGKTIRIAPEMYSLKGKVKITLPYSGRLEAHRLRVFGKKVASDVEVIQAVNLTLDPKAKLVSFEVAHLGQFQCAQGPAPQSCSPMDCGPVPGIPNWICEDGSAGGPTGNCVMDPMGACVWDINWCPGACTPMDCGPAPALAIRCPDGSPSAEVCTRLANGSCGWDIHCDPCVLPAGGMGGMGGGTGHPMSGPDGGTVPPSCPPGQMCPLPPTAPDGGTPPPPCNPMTNPMGCPTPPPCDPNNPMSCQAPDAGTPPPPCNPMTNPMGCPTPPPCDPNNPMSCQAPDAGTPPPCNPMTNPMGCPTPPPCNPMTNPMGCPTPPPCDPNNPMSCPPPPPVCQANCSDPSRTCPPGTQCDPMTGGCTPVGVQCGHNTCGMGEICCNESCGICAPMGATCPAITCASCGTNGQMCPPGTQCDPTGTCVPTGEMCGSTTCGPGEYCCNPSCGICTRMGAACPQVVCASCGGMNPTNPMAPPVTCPPDQQCDPSTGQCVPICNPMDCGPPSGLPNYTCQDGTMGGPTGRCIPASQQTMNPPSPGPMGGPVPPSMGGGGSSPDAGTTPSCPPGQMCPPCPAGQMCPPPPPPPMCVWEIHWCPRACDPMECGPMPGGSNPMCPTGMSTAVCQRNPDGTCSYQIQCTH